MGELEVLIGVVAPYMAQCEVLEGLVGHVAAEFERGGCYFEDSGWAALVLLNGVFVEGIAFVMGGETGFDPAFGSGEVVVCK